MVSVRISLLMVVPFPLNDAASEPDTYIIEWVMVASAHPIV